MANTTKKAEVSSEEIIDGTSLDILGIPSSKVNQFHRKKILTVEQLLDYFPRKYYDFRKPTLIRNAIVNEPAAIVVRISNCRISSKTTTFTGVDDEGNTIPIIFYDLASGKRFKSGGRYVFCGVITYNEYFNCMVMSAPMFSSGDIDSNEEELKKFLRIIPVYSSIKGMSNDYIQQSIAKALAIAEVEDPLTEEGLKLFNIINLKDKYRMMHFPNTMEDLNFARRRDVFDNLFELAEEIAEINQEANQSSPYRLIKNSYAKHIIGQLPFELTEDQKNTLNSIVLKTREGKSTQALVLGDVGSGKTIVAILQLFMAAENGFQGVLLCPTGVLASQHYEEISRYAEQLGVKAVYVYSGMRAKERREVLNAIKTGEASIIVGTHAAISAGVEYHNLGIYITDEEHRFGVKQRTYLKSGGVSGPISNVNRGVHSISMTATPIPRSLAITIYGEGATEIYTIKNKPAGRKPILTMLSDDETEVYESIRQEITKGHQAYVVCPLVDKSEVEALEGVDSATETYHKLQKYFYGTSIKVGLTTGAMNKCEIDENLKSFKDKEYDILVSTTIVEVGVNVPNSTIIAIKNAERFGLAQLHQLRGRVGRSDLQSYCYLISKAKNNEKLKVMTQTNDGFKISERDLELRGAGEFIGVKQSGENKRLELALRSPKVFSKIKEILKNPEMRKTFLKKETEGLF